MTTLNMQYLAEVEESLTSGAFQDIFMYSEEERRFEMLEFLEKLMDLGEQADEVATKIILRRREQADE